MAKGPPSTYDARMLISTYNNYSLDRECSPFAMRDRGRKNILDPKRNITRTQHILLFLLPRSSRAAAPGRGPRGAGATGRSGRWTSCWWWWLRTLFAAAGKEEDGPHRGKRAQKTPQKKHEGSSRLTPPKSTVGGSCLCLDGVKNNTPRALSLTTALSKIDPYGGTLRALRTPKEK